MNKIILGASCVFLLTGCSQSDQFAASVMGGAAVGAVISDDNPVMGMAIGGALGGIISNAQMGGISQSTDDRYRQIIETGQVNHRYYIDNVYGDYDMVVYPGYEFYKTIRGHRYECRSLQVYVYDGPRTYDKKLTYCRSARGWFRV